MTMLSASSSRSDNISQQRPSGTAMHATATIPPSSSHRATTAAAAAPPMRGVRRRREESIEIEELDSDTMRQSSYNYFQRYARPTSPAYNASGYSTNNAAFAFLHATGAHALRSGSSRKRQRTLADHLDELCISGADYVGRSRGTARSTATMSSRDSDSSPDAAMVDSDQSDDAREQDTSSNCDEDDSSSGAETRSELLVYGGVPSIKGFFFGSARRRPMDRVFRHYAAVASQAASASETNGNELVLFRHRPPTPPPSPYRMSMPFFSLSPQELEALTRQEKNKRVVELRDGHDDASAPAWSLAGPYRRSRSGSGSASSTASSPPFRALGVPRTDDDEDDDLDDEDMDGSYCLRKPTPHASGEISHSEWFLDEEL